MKNIISNNSKNVKCPICHSYDVYKFGKNPKTGNQKYQCKSCKHQGTFLNPVKNRPKKDYPKCPVCGSLGFKSFNSANNMVFMFVYFYNFINPHSSLNNLTPAQVAGAEYSERDKQHLLLAS